MKFLDRVQALNSDRDGASHAELLLWCFGAQAVQSAPRKCHHNVDDVTKATGLLASRNVLQSLRVSSQLHHRPIHFQNASVCIESLRLQSVVLLPLRRRL